MRYVRLDTDDSQVDFEWLKAECSLKDIWVIALLEHELGVNYVASEEWSEGHCARFVILAID
jgi:hypothetical protein